MNLYRFDKENHIHQYYKNEKWNNLDGTSTALKIVGGVPLYWASGMALKPLGWSDINNKETKQKNKFSDRLSACLDGFNMVKGIENPKDYLNLLDKCYKNHAMFTKQKADEGTDAHALMEEYIKGEISGNPVKEIHDSIKGMVELSKTIVDKWLFSELCVYSENMWTGGIIDAGAILKTGDMSIFDFKNRDVVRVKDIWQTGGYSIQLKENNGGFDENGNKIFELPFNPKSFIVFPLKKPENYVERFDVEEIEKDYQSINRLYKRDRELGGSL